MNNPRPGMLQAATIESAASAPTRRETVAILAAVCVGEGGLVCMPYIVGGVAERYGVSAGVSGLVSSLQFAAMALIAIGLSLRVHKLDRRRLALAAGALTIVGHLASVTAPVWFAFLASRVVVGAGEGALLTLGTAAAAAAPKPQRMFALVTFAFVAMGGIVFVVMPGAVALLGPIAVFQVLVAIALIGFPFLAAMPRRASAVLVANLDVWRPFPWILVGIALHYMATNSLWAFAERIGVGLQLSADAIGRTFLAGVLLTMAGPIAAAAVQGRWGYRRPILAGVAVLGISCVGLGGASFSSIYLVAFIVLNVTAFYLVPMYRALTAVLDPSGRVAAASIVVQTVGTALGPFLASLALLAGAGYAMVGLYAGLLVVLSGALVMKTAARGDARESGR